MGFSRQKYWSGLPFPFSNGPSFVRPLVAETCPSATQCSWMTCLAVPLLVFTECLILHWPANRWGKFGNSVMANRDNVGIVSELILLGSQINVDSDCSHKIKRHFPLWKNSMTNLDSILKSRDITLLTKVLIVKAMVFPVVMYGYESWTIKKAEHWRIDAFELWCWRKLLRVPWMARRSN